MDKVVTRETVADFMERVDRRRFTKETGYSTQLITRAISNDEMPARWFLKVRAYCQRHGCDLPEHLFNWDDARPGDEGNKQNANTLQGVAEAKSLTPLQNDHG